jgi:hypothetical protein
MPPHQPVPMIPTLICFTHAPEGFVAGKKADYVA